ncbi:MAG: hypothetical protein AAF846_23425 [Chloroflexota bacterium]
MKNVVVLFLLLWISSVVVISQEPDQPPTIIICEGNGCVRSSLDGELSEGITEILFGERPEEAENVLVCHGSGCNWSHIEAEDVDITLGGDGIIQPSEIITEPNTNNPLPEIIFCIDGVGCERSEIPPDMTEDDIDIFVGPKPDDSDTIVCTVGGCQWTPLEPNDLDTIMGGDGDVPESTETNAELVVPFTGQARTGVWERTFDQINWHLNCEDNSDGPSFEDFVANLADLDTELNLDFSNGFTQGLTVVDGISITDIGATVTEQTVGSLTIQFSDGETTTESVYTLVNAEYMILNQALRPNNPNACAFSYRSELNWVRPIVE